MAFQCTTPSNHLKFLALATLLVCLWFLYSIPDLNYNHSKPYSLGLLSSKPGPLGFLPLPEAKEFCRARRWDAYPYRQGHRKIYDLMLINTELEWLEIRMGQMHEQVDYFIIIEAAKTFTDAEKPLHVRENWARFKRYHHKMILHTLDVEDVEFENTWDRERFSRNAMYDQVIPNLTGEQEALQGDVILVSDVDEIPRPDALKALRNCEFPAETTLHSKMHYYSFQWLQRDDWPHPQATFYSFENTVLPDDLRSSHGKEGKNTELYNGAWHCSYCFSTVAEIVTKIKSFSHSEFNRDEFTDKGKIVERIRNGGDMFDRSEQHFDRVEDNLDVPEFLLKHSEKYAYMLDRDPPNANFKDYTAPENEE